MNNNKWGGSVINDQIGKEEKMFEEKIFKTDVSAINFAEGPRSGPPLILLHGGGDSWQVFLPILPSLAEKWHIYALDLRGHGKSDRVPNQYRPENYVTDVRAFFEDYLREPAILFGHSLGGWVALMAAAQLSARVKGLILGDPPLNIERYLAIESSEKNNSMWRAFRELRRSNLSVGEYASKLADFPISESEEGKPIRHKDLPGRDEAYFQNWAKTLSRVDPDVIWYHAEGRMHEYVENVDIDAALQTVSCPVLLLQGDSSQGGIISDSDAEHALSLLSNGSLVKLEGVGHGLGLSMKKEFLILDAVAEFLESL